LTAPHKPLVRGKRGPMAVVRIKNHLRDHRVPFEELDILITKFPNLRE
jgi:hypothetical protein